MFEQIQGHKKQIGLLLNSLKSGKIAHAYIFAGPSLVGKRTVAVEFAKNLLQAKDSNGIFFHPDYLEVLSNDGIKIEQVRELIYKLSLKPYQAKYKVALIDDAETMTVEAQNAILKVLEEPKEYTVIILVTSNPNKLLRTISSRAQKINFGLVTDAKSGRPGLAVKIAADADLQSKMNEHESKYKIIKGKDLADKLILANQLAELETEELKELFDYWLMKIEDDLVNSDISSAKIAKSLEASRRYLEQSVNSKLLLTNLMINI